MAVLGYTELLALVAKKNEEIYQLDVRIEELNKLVEEQKKDIENLEAGLDSIGYLLDK